MKATHYGTCQICGNLQKASARDNLVASHGYTVKWSSRTYHCHGSHRLPLEVSKSYLEANLAYAIARIEKYVESPCPQPTKPGRCPLVEAWKKARSERIETLQFIADAQKRIEGWAPAPQQTVAEVETAASVEKSSRAGIRELSKAAHFAKFNLIQNAQYLESTLQESRFDGKLDPWSVPYAAVNTVKKLVALARKHAEDRDVLDLATHVETLAGVYAEAKAAHAAAK